MSVIDAKSPINLIGQVAIVTSAATPLGAQICRTLLRHNCLVLGVDEKEIPEKEALFTSSASHFQRIHLNLDDNDAVKKIVEHSKARFNKPSIQILVTVGKGDGNTKLGTEISKIMEGSGGGLVVDVLDKATAGDSASAKKGDEKGVRTSVVLVEGSEDGEGWKSLNSPEGADKEVQECVRHFQEVTKNDTNTRKGNKGVAHVLLYLGSELGRQINNAVITANGKWKPL